MNLLNYAQIILILSPSLIDSQKNEWRRSCNSITCSNSTSQLNDDRCEHLGHIRDPFTNECIAKCDSPCINGSCSFCYCTLSTNEDAIKSADPVQCKRILNGTSCQGSGCKFENLTYCGDSYVTNYFDPNECVLRCDEDSCGNGRCSVSGYCVCDSGYRPDVRNPRICVKIAAKVCGECRNGYCNSDGICRCWENYEFDAVTSVCVFKNDPARNQSCNDVCVNGRCNLICVSNTVRVKESSDEVTPRHWSFYLFVTLGAIFGFLALICLIKLVCMLCITCVIAKSPDWNGSSVRYTTTTRTI